MVTKLRIDVQNLSLYTPPMKNIILVMILMSGFVGSVSLAGEETGYGVILGVPSGINVRHWIAEDRSLEANAGWSILNGSKFMLNASYLWNKKDVLELKEETFDLSFGAGLSVRTKSGSQDGEVVFGPRLPIGVSYYFTNPKIELFGEAGLNVGIVPSSDIYMDAGLGVRFYFE